MKNIFPVYKFLNSDIEYQIITLENKDLLSQYMLSNNKKRLIVTSDSSGIGWNETLFPDLKDFVFIEELLVYWTNIKDISGVHLCENLKVLWLDNDDKTEIKFESFPKLEKVVSWNRNGIESVWKSPTINEITVAGLKKIHFEGVENATRIQKLRILKCSINDISFLSNFNQVIFLELLDNNNLENLNPIGNLLGLKHLRVVANKVSDFSFVKNLEFIETCFLSSKIAKFRFEYFNDLQKIKKINLSGNREIQEFNKELQKIFNR